MKSLWNDEVAADFANDLLAQRVYTSRLLGQDESLVLHGGGNTSVKISEKNIFGETEELLYVKGSGWDLATIEKEGFAPVRMDTLLKLAELPELSDMDMVKNQRMAMTNPSAPNPSVEAILHALIPYTFVDHTHADAVITICNTPDGEARIREVYGKKLLMVPYIMPGFVLAKQIHELTQGFDWDSIDGMILENHGVFTFDNDAKKSYEKMIEIVTQAEVYLEKEGAKTLAAEAKEPMSPLFVAEVRKAISEKWGAPVLARVNTSPLAIGYSSLPNIKEVAGQGTLAPDHIINTKRTPLVSGDDFEANLEAYVTDYIRYYKEHNEGEKELDPAPRWVVNPGKGTVSLGRAIKNLKIIGDITAHTMQGQYNAEQLGGWRSLPEKELFDIEYWSLEQAKLAKAGTPKPLQGKVALVSGGFHGIGKACVEKLVAEGAVVSVLDINPEIESRFPQREVLGIRCDVTQDEQLKAAVEQTVHYFGGIDMLVTNAGIFPPSAKIANMDANIWQKSMDINVTSHQRLMQFCIPYLELGHDPAIVIIASKNVPAPGPGAAAYSVSKAGLTQLGRVAAMELGAKGIRVNMVHPNAVYDTALWTPEVLQKRAEHYGLTVEEYKTNNILKTEVRSADVATLTYLLLSTELAKTTGAQIPIDGGNDRVI
ncbi:bifunctional aldolase/short-chain dehydrogenase [Sediminicola luteus]|uniref:Short-chain dehydrogenase n=1 Tax=Sediminicola luteus TaxID=319238 RepID=A0A2A4GA71_9FLAO|nr:bifunctional aldolase/short-chain dehydrogenase [Sediminicola luteus]PCE64652.1 short-chain dehydrogenase [Sediminicola luteus]